MRLELAQMIRKARHRLPRSVGGARLWLTLQDHLVASHHLSSRRRHELMQAWGRCRTPGDYFDFASRVLPSHQVRSEILSFLGLARSRAPRTVMEIGTAEGGTNFLLGAALPDVTLKIAVDLHVQNTKLLRAFTRPGLEQVFVHASSYAPATVDRVHGLLDGRPLDLLFIDGDHTYDGATADFSAYAPFVRSGGLIAFHDIMQDHWTRYGRETGRWAGDVPRVWQELKSTFAETWEFVADREQDGLGIGVGRVG